MVIRSRLGVAVSAIALLGMTVPASAQSWGRGPGRHDEHGHRDHDNGGAVAGALIIGGILGALLVSSKKKADVVVEQAPPPPPPGEPAAAPAEPPSAFD